MSDRGFTSGDPLGGGPEQPPAPAPAPGGGLWSGDQAGLPGVPGYTGPAPPGAGGQGIAAQAPMAGRPVLAGWWRRVGAQLIDGLIITAGAALLFVLITAPFSIGFFASDEVGAVAIIVGALLALLCVAVVALLYAPALMARTNGQTLGRKATDIRVIRTDGRPITFGFAMLREVVVKTLLFGVVGGMTIGIAQLVDVLWPLWDEENRALHDFIVNTRTVRV
jgi:uncharacterized RDD family membrane protein YckC